MNRIKRIIDVLMTLTLIPLMAYQVTGEAAHEWLGISMVLLVIIHQVLNRKWYSAIFKGKYNSYRIINSIITILLLISFVLTAISGVSMSNHAVPFLYNLVNVNTARVMHLAFSYWSFILMGFHIGMHVSVMTARIPSKMKNVLAIIFTLLAGYGFYLLLKSGIVNYITFKTHFAFLDYEKPATLVFLENVSMIIFFAFVAHNVASIVNNTSKKEVKALDLISKKTTKEKILINIIYLLAAFCVGLVLNMFTAKNDSDNNSWQSNTFQNFETTKK